MWDPYADFRKETLSNGIDVYVNTWKDRPWEVMGFIVHSGAKEDPKGLEGSAHYVEHLVSNNVLGIKKEEIKKFFEYFGGDVELGSTGYLGTSYKFFSPANSNILACALNIFGLMLMNSRLENSIEREREIIISEFNQNFPQAINYEILRRGKRALYSGHQLERFITSLGSLESIKMIKKNDLQEFYDQFYTPQNMSIIAVGGLTLNEVVKYLGQSPFLAIKKGVRNFLPSPLKEFQKPIETQCEFKFSDFAKQPLQSIQYGTIACIPGTADYLVSRLIKEMLEDILFEEIREKRGWSYSFDILVKGYKEIYEFRMISKSILLNALGSIQSVVNDCIHSLDEKEDLFENKKRFFLTQLDMVDLSANNLCDNVIDALIFEQRIISNEEQRKKIEAITWKDVKDVLPYLKPEHRWTVIVQP